MRICCKFLILGALGLAIFPMRVSGPFICNDLFASSDVNGQLRKKFVSRILKKLLLARVSYLEVKISSHVHSLEFALRVIRSIF